MSREERSIDIDGYGTIVVREMDVEGIVYFYQDEKKFAALSSFLMGDFSRVEEVFRFCIDKDFKDIKHLGGSDFMRLVNEVREVNKNFFATLRAEMSKMVPPAKGKE